MIVINSVTSTRFSFNGVEYHKNFMPFITGDKVSIINVYDSCIVLTSAPTIYSDYTVNGVTYASAAALQAALLDVIYTRNSLSGGGGGISGTVGQIAKFTSTDEVGNSILSEIGSAIHLTNGGSSFASFGIVNPGTPGAPGVDNDAYIGSTINNDFLIRVNNTEALRVDTALRLKIANIPNATTDTDKFLVSDGGVVKYRTGAEVIADLGITNHNPVTIGTANGLSLSGQVLSLGLASSINAGALSSTDWNTFNSKQPAGNYVTLDTSQTITGIKVFESFRLQIEGVGTSQPTVFQNSSSLGIGSSGYNTLGFNGSSDLFFNDGTSANTVVLSFSNTSPRSYLLPDVSGTLALTSNITSAISGTTNYLPKFTSANAIGNSQLQDNGTNVSIGYTTNPALYKLDVNGTGRFSGAIIATGSSASFTINRRDNSAYAGGLYSPSGSILLDMAGVGTALSFAASTGAATFSSSVTATAYFESSSVAGKNILTTNPITQLNLDVIKYTRKSDENKDVRYGYSAEQVHAIMPELTDKDVSSVKYLDVHTVLIAQLTNRIKELEARLN